MDSNFYLQELDRVNFSDQDLSGSCFVRATLQGCDFTGADLRRADFTGVCVDDFLSCIFKNALLTKTLIDSAVLKDYRFTTMIKNTRGLQSFVIVGTKTETYHVKALDSDKAIQTAKDSEDFDPDEWDDYDVEFENPEAAIKLLSDNKETKDLQSFIISATKYEKYTVMALNYDNAIQVIENSPGFDLSDWDDYEINPGPK